MTRILPVVIALLLSTSNLSAQGTFRLSSSDVAEGATIKAEQVFNSFGCTGQNVSPAITWSNAPKETKSFAILWDDQAGRAGLGDGGWGKMEREETERFLHMPDRDTDADVLRINAAGPQCRIVHLRTARMRDGIANHRQPRRRREAPGVGAPVHQFIKQ